MPHPLETESSFNAPYVRRAVTSARAQHRNDANRHLNGGAPDISVAEHRRRLRVGVETARRYLARGIFDRDLALTLIRENRAEHSALIAGGRS